MCICKNYSATKPSSHIIIPKEAVLQSRNRKFLPTGGWMETEFQVPSILGLCNPMQSIVRSITKFICFDIKATVNLTIFNCFQTKPIISFKFIQSEMAVKKQLTVQCQYHKRQKKLYCLSLHEKIPSQCQRKQVWGIEVTNHCVTDASFSSSVTAEFLGYSTCT